MPVTSQSLQSITGLQLPDGSSADAVLTLDYGGDCLAGGSDFRTPLYVDGCLPAWAVDVAAAGGGVPLYECNASSSCGSDCPQRLVQRGSGAALELVDAGTRGWGLATTAALPRGAFVAEYAGQLVSSTAPPPAGAGGHKYHLTFTERSERRSLATCVDATTSGSEARFVNHSCAPNCALLGVRVANSVPRLALFALAALPAGTELTVAYGDGKGGGSAATAEGAAVHALPCLCGAAGCRGRLPLAP